MSDANRYSKLLEPGQIGKVKTRNRSYKSAAATFCFSDTEFDTMSEKVLGLPTAPLLANDELYRARQGKVPELHLIGDGKQAGMIVHAVRSGYHTAKQI